MSNVLRDVLWTEKYRPTELGQLALEEETRATLEAYVEGGEIPHLLLVGPPGSGKTTVARILTEAIDCQVLALNASAERGIDVVRHKIGNFVVSMLGARWNIVFLDEADEMTPDAQTAMRNTIESFADRSRFVMTANRLHKIIGPIQSRCQIITLGRPPMKERYRVLASVLTAEEIPFEPQVAVGYADKYGDMRRMLMASQKAWLQRSQGVDLLPLVATTGADGAAMFEMLASKNWTSLRRLCASGEIDHQQALRELFWSVPDDHPRAGFLRHVIGRGVHESGFTPDPVVLFLGVCAEAMEGLS